MSVTGTPPGGIAGLDKPARKPRTRNRLGLEVNVMRLQAMLKTQLDPKTRSRLTRQLERDKAALAAHAT
jgi:hypothetical protein